MAEMAWAVPALWEGVGVMRLEFERERTIIIKNKTMRDVWDVLKKNAYREQDPVILCGPFNDYHRDGLTCIFKEMRITKDGRRIPNEDYRGEMHVTPYGVDAFGVVFCFRPIEFIDPALFWQAVDKLISQLEQ